MWQETPPDQRINQFRLEDAVAAGASVVATACPYCLLMFDDAIRSTDRAESMQVVDVAEVLAGRLPAEPTAAPREPLAVTEAVSPAGQSGSPEGVAEPGGGNGG